MALKLEVFETSPAPKDREGPARPETVVLDTLALEEAKLASYDQGYSAGWEDAASANSEDQTRMRADLSRNLQQLSFTYHEARTHVLTALEPLLTGMVERILPVMARQSLAPMILELLRPEAEKASEAPVTLVINPAVRASVDALLEQETSLPLVIEEEPTLGEGQAYLRFDRGEMQIDLDEAAQKIGAAVNNFFIMQVKDSQNG